MASIASFPPASHVHGPPPPASERLSPNPIARTVGFLRRFRTDKSDALMVFFLIPAISVVFIFALSPAVEDAGTVWTFAAAQSDDPEHEAPPVVETWQTRCVYPVSGTYARFQRVLLCAVIIVVVVYRSHRWVVVAGSAWMAGYLAPAVVHAMALTFWPSDGLDADIRPLTLIMAISLGLSTGVPYMAGPRATLSKVALQILFSGAAVCFLREAMRWDQVGHWVIIDVDRFYESEADIATLFGYENICDAVQVDTASVFRGTGDRLEPTRWIRSSWQNHTSSETTLGKMLCSWYTVYLKILFSAFIMITPRRSIRNWMVRYVAAVRHEHGEPTYRFVGRTLLAALVSFWRGPLFNIVLFPIAPLNWILTRAWKSFARERPYLIPRFAASPNNLQLPMEPPLEGIVRFSRAVSLMAYCFFLLAPTVISILVTNLVILSWVEEALDDLPEQDSITSVGQWAPWISVGVSIFISFKTRFFPSPRDKQSSEEGAILLHELEQAQRDLGASIELHPILERVHHWLLHRAPPLAHGFLQVLGFYIETRIWWNDPFKMSWQCDDCGRHIPANERLTGTVVPGEEDDEVFTRFLEGVSSSPRFVLKATSNCSRETYAKYLPCACADCRGEPCAGVEYSTDEEQTRIGALQGEARCGSAGEAV